MLLVGTNAFSRKKRHFLFVTLDYLIIHWLFVGFVVAPMDAVLGYRHTAFPDRVTRRIIFDRF